MEENGDNFHIFDDGLTMHEIVSRGVDMGSRHKWAALRKIANLRNVNLSRSGVFEVYTTVDRAQEAVSNYLRTMFSVDDWLRDQTTGARASVGVKEESKKLFKLWHPSEEFVDRPKISGKAGTQLEFDFRIGNNYVDAITPNAVASAGVLRKLLAISDRIRGDIDTTIVIDDRMESDAAHREGEIISVASNVIMFSSLARNAMRVDVAA